MRTPVILVAGQGDTDAVVDEMLCRAGTVVIEHRFDGHVVQRRMISERRGARTIAKAALELAHGCVSCTIRDDVLLMLRKLHRSADVARIVVHMDKWLEPEPLCWAIEHIRVMPGVGFPTGPAARDVYIGAVVICLDSLHWLSQALGDDELSDGRTVAQVVVSQSEFADVLLCSQPEDVLGQVLTRLSPRAAVITEPAAIEAAMNALGPGARRGSSDDPHGHLLAGQPPLGKTGAVGLVEFHTRRPFHPRRLHEALDTVLDGVIRARGRIWLASNAEQVMWLESAGGGMRVSSAGPWLAAMTESQWNCCDPERRALGAALWDDSHGDRHTSVVILTCGADPDTLYDTLAAAVLTDEEMREHHHWHQLQDPFGEWHQDPCNPTIDAAGVPVDTREGESS